MGIIWTIIIGFVAGIIAKFLHPGSSNEPSGFILTAALGIVGALRRGRHAFQHKNCSRRQCYGTARGSRQICIRPGLFPQALLP